MLVLKRLDDARRDGDRIYAVIRSIGTLERRQGAGGLRAERGRAGQAHLRRAYEPAGIAPATVELVEAHGTGTRVGDATELAGARGGLPRGSGATARGAPSGRSSRRSAIPRPRRGPRG